MLRRRTYLVVVRRPSTQLQHSMHRCRIAVVVPATQELQGGMHRSFNIMNVDIEPIAIQSQQEDIVKQIALMVES